MGHYAFRRFRDGAAPSINEEEEASLFLIGHRADGRWEVEYSRGKHKRIYDRLIDASAGAVDEATRESGPCRIRVQRDSLSVVFLAHAHSGG